MKNLLLFFLLTVLLSAQSDEGSRGRFWKADLPGGNYMVAISSITAVSNHAYLMDGGVVVTEVTIDTTGTTVARFYQLTPVTEYSKLNITGLLSERIKELSEMQEEITGADPMTTVQKKYPLTTHAKTVEYQLSSLTDLKSLYESISKAVERGKGGRFSIKGSE